MKSLTDHVIESGGIPAALLPREFLITTTADYSAEDYIAAYLKEKFQKTPCRPYTGTTKLDDHVDVWAQNRKKAIDKLLYDSRQMVQHPPPLASLESNPVLKPICKSKLYKRLTPMVQAIYPLVENETVKSMAPQYLTEDWQSLVTGTLIYHRVTNFSDFYFAIPDIRFDVNTGEWQHSYFSEVTKASLRGYTVELLLSGQDEEIALWHKRATKKDYLLLKESGDWCIRIMHDEERITWKLKEKLSTQENQSLIDALATLETSSHEERQQTLMALVPAVIGKIEQADIVELNPLAKPARALLPLVTSGGQQILNVILDIASTLSWATPAGPFVSAGVTLFQFLLGLLPNDSRPSLEDLLSSTAQQITETLKSWDEKQKLADEIASVKGFAQWVTSLKVLLSNREPKTFALHVAGEGGSIIEQLNNQISPQKGSLLNLMTMLEEDDDFGGDIKEQPAYRSAAHWELVKNKVIVLLYVKINYLMALKLKTSLYATLYDLGFNEKGEPAELNEKNPDGTFKQLQTTITQFTKEMNELIERVTDRRVAMVYEQVEDTSVARSRNGGWGLDHRNSHDGLRRYFDSDETQSAGRRPDRVELLRDQSDSPDNVNFQVKSRATISGVPTETGEVAYWDGQRLAYYDRCLLPPENEKPRDFVVSDEYTITHIAKKDPHPKSKHNYRLHDWYHVGLRFNAYKNAIGNEIKELGWSDAVLKWGEGIQTLSQKITPYIPQNIHSLTIDSWQPDANNKHKDDPLWNVAGVEVRYQFSLSTGFHESNISSDVLSTGWQYPKKSQLPVIGHVPEQGDFLKYVTHVFMYRQFRLNTNTSESKLVAKIGRDKKTELFPTSHIDTLASTNEERALLNAPPPLASNPVTLFSQESGQRDSHSGDSNREKHGAISLQR